MDSISKNFEQKEEEEQSLQKTHQSFEEFLSTLPRQCGWTPLVDCYLYQGCWHNPFFLRGVIAAQQHFEAQPTDIFLCSAPKSGTTWLKALAFAIVTRKKYSDLSSHPLLSTMPHQCIPSLEGDVASKEHDDQIAELPFLATHIPYHSLPKSIISCGCKIVYIFRDPKDAFVSMWHFVSRITPKDATYISLEEALELFCEGVSLYGPYWDHISADFIGHPFSVEEENEGVLQKIADLCSFEYLSDLDVNKNGKNGPNPAVAIENSAFFRKGKIGDWQSHLTPEMAERLDQVTREKFGGTGLPSYVSDASTYGAVCLSGLLTVRLALFSFFLVVGLIWIVE
ncbi:Sulfotransferase domain [Dillenia turbinata]|uniref:Sulfotransferase n=1 Tax=Dillenia turbinata TaxID=194707 RepID=A0AAN8Z2Z6_9MAGN